MLFNEIKNASSARDEASWYHPHLLRNIFRNLLAVTGLPVAGYCTVHRHRSGTNFDGMPFSCAAFSIRGAL